MIAAALLGCRSPPPAAPVVPVDWGEVSVHATGQLEIDAKVPVLCGDDDGLVFRAHSAQDAPWWTLSLERRRMGELLRQVPILGLLVAADRTGSPQRWASDSVSAGTLAGGSWSGVVLDASGPIGPVRVDVEVRCGNGPGHVPAAVGAILAEVAGMRPEDVRPYATADLGRVQVPGPVSILAPRDRAPDWLRQVRERLPDGFVAYQGTSRFAPPDQGRSTAGQNLDPGRVELVVAAGTGPVDLVRTANVDPVNEGLDSIDVARRVQSWVDRFGGDPVQADAESVTVQLPENVDSAEAAREAASFCPAVIEQAGAVSSYALEIDRNHQLWCWWE